MEWYWVVAIILGWIAGLFAYCQLADRFDDGSVGRSVLLLCLYAVLYASWPVIILVAGLIDAAWYAWVFIVIEAVCLAFLIPPLAENISKRGWWSPDDSVLLKAESLMLVAICLIIAPLGLGLMYNASPS